MKKLIFFVVMSLMISTIGSARHRILKPKYVAQVNRIAPSHFVQSRLGQIDTLTNEYEPPYYIFENEFQMEYEATKLTPVRRCILKEIWVGFWNDDVTATQSKDVQFYVWTDLKGLPGTQLITVDQKVTLDADVAEWIVVDVSESNLVFDRSFWVGHRESSVGAPSSLIDTIVTPDANFYSEDGTIWTEDEFDYLQMAVVEYTDAGEPNIAVTPDTLFFKISGGTQFLLNKASKPTAKLLDKIRSSLKIEQVHLSRSTPKWTSQQFDTLSNEYTDPVFAFDDEFQTEYEATRLIAPQASILKTIMIAFYNYETSAQSKECHFYVWSDNDGIPGTVLISDSGTVTVDANDAIWIEVDVADANLTVNGAFWIGHREVTIGAPSSLADETPTPGANFFSNDGVNWEEESYDYLQMAVVQRSENPLQAQGMMIIHNHGNADLVVSKIFSDQNWIISIDPISFTVGPEKSQQVKVTVSAEGLAGGLYHGSIQIQSNDPDTPNFSEPIILDFIKTSVEKDNLPDDNPASFMLDQNYPNPFNPATVIRYRLSEVSQVSLKVFNPLGQLIKILVDEKQPAGNYEVSWDSRNEFGEGVAGGIYFYQLKAEKLILARKMLLIR